MKEDAKFFFCIFFIFFLKLIIVFVLVFNKMFSSESICARGISSSSFNQLNSSEINSSETESKIELLNIQIRALILYDYKKGLKAIECLNSINKLFGADTVSRSTVFKYYSNFKNNNFDLSEPKRSGRPSILTNEELQMAVESSPSINTIELANQFDISIETIRRHLHQIGYVPKYLKWVPHKLSDFNKSYRVTVCERLIQLNDLENIIPLIVTMDEKWIYFDNTCREMVWTKEGEEPDEIARKTITNKKVMISVWWSSYGIVHKYYTSPGHAVDANEYASQLDQVKDNLRKVFPSSLLRKGI
jgi:transposase